MRRVRNAVLCAVLVIVGASSGTAVADVDDQGPLAALKEGATVYAPAIRLEIPAVVPVIEDRSVEQMIRDVWPDNLERRALAIAYRESRYQPGVRTWCCFGVFQIHKVHLKWMGPEIGVWTIEELYDPLTNVKAAYALFLRDGWQPWTCCV